jgi:hypothetical protein
LTQIPPGSASVSRRAATIDAVAENVIVLDDDVAEIDADTKLDPPLDRHLGVALSHGGLYLHGALHRINDAGKFDKQSVASRLDDAALMLADVRVDELTAMSFEARQSAGLIRAHQPAVASDIGGDDGRKTALDPLSAQSSLPGATRASLGSWPIA